MNIQKKVRNLAASLVVPIVSLILSLTMGCAIIFVMGLNPVAAMAAMFSGAFGGLSAFGETMVKMTPLLCTGVSFALANRCGLINIGVEGQLYMGGLLAVVVALFGDGLPVYIHLPLTIAAGFIGGGLWGMLAAYFKVRFGTNEMISTIMLNYIATYFVNFMVTNVLIEPPGTMPRTALMPSTAQFPRIISGMRVHWGIVLALMSLLFYYVFLWKTRSGFETRVVGLNNEAARYAGINEKKRVLTAMFLSGGIAGLADVVEIMGVQMRMYPNFSSGYGFEGIAVALLGQQAPIGIFFAAFLFGALSAGSNLMQMTVHIPSALTYIIQSLVIVFVVSGQYGKEFIRTWKARLYRGRR